MPKAPNMYQCSNCGGYMTHRERNKKRVIITRADGSKVQFDQDLCPSCEAQETDSREDLKQLKSPTAGRGGGQQGPTQPGPGTGDRHTGSASGVPVRRSRPAEGGGSTSRRRGNPAASAAR